MKRYGSSCPQVSKTFLIFLSKMRDRHFPNYTADQSGQEGFTLLEIIMVLLLLGVTGAMAGLGVLQLSQGFVFSRANAETAGKGQLAMLRLTQEFTVIRRVSTGTASSITFSSFHDGGVSKTYTLSVNGTDLIVNDGTTSDILVDNVSGFSLAYYDTYDGSSATTWSASKKIIEISLTLTGAQGINTTFSTKVTPRNLRS